MILTIPLSYYIALLSLLFLVIEAFLKRYKPWSIPAIVTYLTIGIWYFTEIWYTPERLIGFEPSILELAYIQVFIFLISFRFLVPIASRFFQKQSSTVTPSIPDKLTLLPHKLLIIVIILWLILFIYGVSRLDWDISQALLPRGGRWAPKLWNRGALGQGFDFLVSAGGYTYTLLCSLFGILIFFQRKLQFKAINLFMILLSWPSFYLSGTRNVFLAVMMPAYLTYLLISRQKIWIKAIVSVILLLSVNYLFLISISFRNIGIISFFEKQVNQSIGEKHLGLNTTEELLYINTFYENGRFNLSYGMDYIAELLNLVPRLLLPNKPLIGHQYNLLRNPDTGIQATISAGIIGRGVMNFGRFLGPLFPAFLMALWSGFLSNLWMQRFSILRLSLFLVGLGITPNLGRDITLLVLWPIIFGYCLVLFLERKYKYKQKSVLNALNQH